MVERDEPIGGLDSFARFSLRFDRLILDNEMLQENNRRLMGVLTSYISRLTEPQTPPTQVGE